MLADKDRIFTNLYGLDDWGLDGARRSMRAIMRNPAVHSGVDEHGSYIRAAFDLERGAYATVMLREIMKNDEVGSGDDGVDGGGEDQPE